MNHGESGLHGLRGRLIDGGNKNGETQKLYLMIFLGTTAYFLHLFRKPPELRLEITRSPLARYEDSATDDATRQRATMTETTQAFNTKCRCKMTTHDVRQYGLKRRRKEILCKRVLQIIRGPIFQICPNVDL
ncbi:hypothetical protein BDN70DRAFT_897151 [Pholiota conissans]|uniref:Uncharacterized protein n=1 Tax=Pholiota conissans TaxID=109636 RepID=A0A9P5YZ20_9AGAR|nr:hypothetical protein BDN70DRAFT_897151 [Pholiota conissans]